MSVYDDLLQTLGVDTNELPDSLQTTMWKAICEKLGVDTSDMEDNLITSYCNQICTEYCPPEDGGGGGSDDTSLKDIIERTAVNPTLPSDLTKIGDYAFYKCTNLALTSLPSGITEIGSYAFNNCKGLTELTFEGTPTNIHTAAFKLCSNLLTINVPWAEGAVANAPWGATNATINYNYTGG